MKAEFMIIKNEMKDMYQMISLGTPVCGDLCYAEWQGEKRLIQQ